MAGDFVYDSRAVANYLIGKAGAGGLDSLQVMKLVYIAHGFVLAVLDRPLLEDDVEAWQHGPVVRRVYHCLPGGAAAIVRPIFEHAPAIDDDHDEAVGIVDSMFEKFGEIPGLYLSSLTHKPGSPWKKTWDTYGKNAVIPQDLIQKHYRDILIRAKTAREKGETYAPDVL